MKKTFLLERSHPVLGAQVSVSFSVEKGHLCDVSVSSKSENSSYNEEARLIRQTMNGKSLIEASKAEKQAFNRIQHATDGASPGLLPWGIFGELIERAQREEVRAYE